MAFDFAAAKALLHRKVQDTFSMDAMYWDITLAQPVPLRIRWHYKETLTGDIESEGYPMVVDLIEKVIFDKPDLVLKGVTPQQGGRIQFVAPGWSALLVISSQDAEDDGPIEQAWRVAKWHGKFYP